MSLSNTINYLLILYVIGYFLLLVTNSYKNINDKTINLTNNYKSINYDK